MIGSILFVSHDINEEMSTGIGGLICLIILFLISRYLLMFEVLGLLFTTTGLLSSENFKIKNLLY